MSEVAAPVTLTHAGGTLELPVVSATKGNNSGITRIKCGLILRRVSAAKWRARTIGELPNEGGNLKPDLCLGAHLP